MNTKRSALVTDDLGVIAISPTEWRVSDLSIDEKDGLSLIGFVQKVDEVYEITTIGRPLIRTYVGSFNAALDALSCRHAL